MNRLHRASPLFIALASTLSLAAAGCGGSNENLPPPPPTPPAPPTAAVTAPPAPTETAAPQPAGPPVDLVQGTASPDPQPPLPTVRILSPTKGQVIPAAKATDFAIKLDVKNWKTAPGDAHVHLILDNKPYKPIYDTKAPIKISDLIHDEAPFEGEHVLVAFPSRANHESVKTKGALTMVSFWVGKKGDSKDDPTTKPMLIYSRPKGAYKADMANHILIDFQLANATLGTGKDSVRITVDGPGITGDKTASVNQFGTPYFSDNAQDGSYTVKLDLIGPDSAPIPGAWNSTTRTITVDHNAPPDPTPAAAPPADNKSDKKGDKDKK